MKFSFRMEDGREELQSLNSLSRLYSATRLIVARFCCLKSELRVNYRVGNFSCIWEEMAIELQNEGGLQRRTRDGVTILVPG